jgi:biopolymer transport protein ExbD
MPLTTHFASSDDGPVLARRRLPIDNNLDMTPMIDVTFLLLIFFLVASVPDVRAALELPAAEHGVAVGSREALIVRIVQGAGSRDDAAVFLGDDKGASPLAGSPAERQAAVRAAAEDAARRGLRHVLIEADKHMRHRQVVRYVRAASVPGVSVDFAVREMD